MGFAHLHLHSEYSFLDGSIKIKELFKRVKELGQNSVAITEHGHMHALVKKYKLAKEAGVKLIIGCEIYICNDISQKDTKRNHFLLLAKNNEGLANLNKIISIANKDGFYYKPRVDKNLLRKYSKGIIASTACIAGDIQQALIHNDYEKAKQLALEYQDIFGKDNFFFEFHNHFIEEEQISNEGMLKLSKELGIEGFAANDAHYLKKEDSIAHDILLCIQTKKKVEDRNRMKFPGSHFYVKSEEEMLELFPNNPELIHNTQKIADRCNVEIDLGNTYFPEFNIQKGEDYKSVLEKLCYEGLDKKYDSSDKELYKQAKERLDFELSVINKMGFAAYFLIVADFIREAKTFCQVGPGRGCVFPDTKITLSNGTEKKIKDVKIGDNVITHKANNFEVKNVFKYDCDEEIVKITVRNEDLCLTLDHKIFAIKSKKCSVQGEKLGICKPGCNRRCDNKLYENYNLDWIEAGELKKDDFVVFPRFKSKNKEIVFDLLEFVKNRENENYLKFDDNSIWYEIGTNNLETKKIPRYIEFNEDLAKFLGYYIAEGYSRVDYRRSEIGLCFHSKEENYANEVVNLFNRNFNLESKIVRPKDEDKNSIEVIANSKIVGEFLTQICGKGAFNKKIYDKLILEGKDELMKILISYMFRGDGCDGKSNKTISIKYSTVSQELSSQLKLLLSRFGYFANIHKRENCKENNNFNIEYSVKLAGRQLLNWNDDFVDFQIPVKEQKYYRNDSFFVDENYIYIKIKDVKRENYKGDVYDLSVGKDKSYVASGIAIHNSGAGSIVAYVLGITQLEPLNLQLLFERFLNPERISLPDFDVDFGDRDMVLDYIREKYGDDKVALIGTYGTMMAKAVLKDVARALDIPFEIANKMTKFVTEKTIADSLNLKDESGKLINQELISYQKKYPFLFEIAQKLEGTVRQPGIHACGVVWGPKEITHYLPVFKKDNNIVTQMDKDEVEERGLVKFDFLGLETLNVIQKVLDYIGKSGEWLENIDLDDLNVYDMLAKGKSIGVFQVESVGMRKTLNLVKPTCFDDIIAIVALYRPGPMQYLEVYANRKHKREEAIYPHPKAEEILGPTYGIMVYQEQVMLLSRVLAGFTMGESDVLRKAIGKKKLDLMEKMENQFKEGCIKLSGMKESVVNHLWDDIVKFASYSFNKSHAAAYAMISYRTAYLKYYYPLEFFTATISSSTTDIEKMAFYVEAAKEEGIRILPPHINFSQRYFSFEKPDENVNINSQNCEDKGAIRFGFSGIKNVGESAIEEILKNRPFKNFQDFINKVDLSKINKRVQKHLIMCGAFEGLGHNRAELLACYQNVKKQDVNKTQQKTLFGSVANQTQIEQKQDCKLGEILSFESEVLGLPISGHLLDQYPLSKSPRFDKLNNLREDRELECFGLVKSFRRIFTRKGDEMAFIDLEDRTDVKSIVVFPNVFNQVNFAEIQVESPLIISGFLKDGSFIATEIIIYKQNSKKIVKEEQESLNDNKKSNTNPKKSKSVLSYF